MSGTMPEDFKTFAEKEEEPEHALGHRAQLRASEFLLTWGHEVPKAAPWVPGFSTLGCRVLSIEGVPSVGLQRCSGMMRICIPSWK